MKIITYFKSDWLAQRLDTTQVQSQLMKVKITLIVMAPALTSAVGSLSLSALLCW